MVYEFTRAFDFSCHTWAMKTLTAAQPLPKFLQISELLSRQIRAGHFRPGERLPTEAELAQSLQVAVGTLRKAMEVLQQQGVLERIQGSGTYVRNTGTGKSIYEFFRLELHDGPGMPSAHILSVDKLKTPADISSFGLASKKSSAWRIRRLRLLNQTPVALEEIWLDAKRSQQLKADQLGESMYLFYQQNFDLWISRVEDHIYTQTVPDWTVNAFGLRAKKIAGYIERLSWTANNELAEFSKTWFNPQVCRYSSRISH